MCVVALVDEKDGIAFVGCVCIVISSEIVASVVKVGNANVMVLLSPKNPQPW